MIAFAIDAGGRSTLPPVSKFMQSMTPLAVAMHPSNPNAAARCMTCF